MGPPHGADDVRPYLAEMTDKTVWMGQLIKLVVDSQICLVFAAENRTISQK